MNFAIHISTKNRIEDLKITLQNIQPLLENPKVACVVFDDGSTDGTSQWVNEHFPQIEVLRNPTSKGYLYCRNQMLQASTADVAISLDDDAHFLTSNVLETIENHFTQNKTCGVIAFRILWSKTIPATTTTTAVVEHVKSFVGCGHAWLLKAWQSVPNYPEWYEFYGEENFASLQLFKKGYTVEYLPSILVMHRVELKKRTQTNQDFEFRYRRAIRADWYNFFLFYPLNVAVKLFLYSIFMQLKKIIKGEFKLIKPLLLAKIDLVLKMNKILKNRNPLTQTEFKNYTKQSESKLFWNPNK